MKISHTIAALVFALTLTLTLVVSAGTAWAGSGPRHAPPQDQQGQASVSWE